MKFGLWCVKLLHEYVDISALTHSPPERGREDSQARERVGPGLYRLPTRRDAYSDFRDIRKYYGGICCLKIKMIP